jgi:hypothetical protein
MANSPRGQLTAELTPFMSFAIFLDGTEVEDGADTVDEALPLATGEETMTCRAAVAGALVALAIGTTGCSEPYEFPDWTIPVPEGTPIIERSVLPIEERTEQITLVADLVIGAEGTDPNYLFNFGLVEKDVAVDRQGRMYVVDGISRRVQVFDASGTYLQTLGREGQGPGEFGRPPAQVTVADGRVFVAENFGGTLQEWNADGAHVGRREMGDIRRFQELEGTTAGDFIVAHDVDIPGERYRWNVRISRLSRDGESVIFEKADAELPLRPSARNPDVMVPPSIMLGRFRPVFASSASGAVYLSAADEYQVLALDETGTARWALRVPWDRREATEEEIDEALAALRERRSNAREGVAIEVTRDDVAVLGPHPSVSRMEVDGHGHLYVFPYGDPFSSESNVPVDVYSAAGELLFSGLLGVDGGEASAPRSWRAAFDDYVYRIGDDEQSGEEALFRYRLVEPFE